MDLKNLAKLKEKLVRAKEFQPVMDYFLTEFGENMGFLGLGKPIQSELLQRAIVAIGKQIFPDARALVFDRICLIELPGHQFIHGGFSLNGCQSMLIYFDDVQMGLIAVALSMSGEMRFARFSTELLKPDTEPSEN